MGIRTSTSIKASQRTTLVQGLTAQTLQKIQNSNSNPHHPLLLTNASASGSVTGSGSGSGSIILEQARTYAARGGAPLIKGELVHAIMTLRHSNKSPVSVSMYMALMERGVEELYALLRAALYSPEALQPLMDALDQQQPAISIPIPTPVSTPAIVHGDYVTLPSAPPMKKCS